MRQMSWKDAIVAVLAQSAEPMRYPEIAEAIISSGLKTDVGATPANTVGATISSSIQKDGDETPFVRTSRGIYALKESAVLGSALDEDEEEAQSDTGLLNAFGMYWNRNHVIWSASPKILGRWSKGDAIDFAEEQGVYLLHDGREVIYVGQASEGSLGSRLAAHATDRLAGRWDRFSWFGIFPVDETGKLRTQPPANLNAATLIVTMEALLIEGLEPRQNRQRGAGFSAIEYLQVEDPELSNERTKRVLERALRNFS